jgi:hypothetical protein
VREIVIIISDLYLGGDFSGHVAGAAPSPVAALDLPGLEDAVRFGQTSALEGGWRAWLARVTGRDDLTHAAPAALAAVISRARPSEGGAVWIATPMHLIAGLTSLHLDYRSLLNLSADELTRLAEDFTATFGDTDFHLRPTSSGALLLQTRAALDVITTEPSRALARELGESLPTGRDAAVLKRLGAEIDMWLHSHPLNEARLRRRELPVSTLWLWGGGRLLQVENDPMQLARQRPSSSPSVALAAFGSEPYLAGLCFLQGVPLHPLPDRLPDSAQRPDAQRSVFVAEVTALLHANPHWTMFDALTHIDTGFIEPSMDALRRGAVDSVVVIANDTQLHIARRNRLKFWRPRPKSGRAALRGLCS